MKHLLILIFLAVAATAQAQQKKIYVNPGHGGWSPNDRPMATISHPMLASTGRPDTCGFYESNTNLWKGLELRNRLVATGKYQVKMSRIKNGPFPWVSGAANEFRYDRQLPVISAEVDTWGADMFISIHSNAAGDGQCANYPLFLYRGLDTEEACSGSRAMCETVWPYHMELFDKKFELITAYTTSKNIRGDRNFYNYTWQNDKGYYGYLGVLMHATPGFLVEGYFHTYQPARHRALNQDWCRQEGLRYFRGIQAYFGEEEDQTGCIMGEVRSQRGTMSTYGDKYKYYDDFSYDKWLPVNGATIRLTDVNYKPLKTYQVDENFNGVFVFTDLEPDTYYIEIKADGYKTKQNGSNKVVVKPNTTQYKHFYLVSGTSEDFDDSEQDAIESITADSDVNDRQTVRVYDAAGKFVLTTTRNALESQQLPAGVYFLESNGRTVKYATK